MKIIRNPIIYWQRKAELDKQIARAIKHHRKHSHLERERRYIMTAIIAYENRCASRALPTRDSADRGSPLPPGSPVTYSAEETYGAPV